MNIKKAIRSWRFWLGLFVIGFLAFFAITVGLVGANFLFIARMPTSDMEPTIPAGSQLEGNGVDYLFEPPSRGDIVYFRVAGLPSLPQDRLFVKRIIGLPGETLRIDESGALFINGKLTTISNHTGKIIISNSPAMMTHLGIGSNLFYVIGDNTANSFDSRQFGLVPRQNIRGRIVSIRPP